MELKDLTPEQLNELKNAFDSAILSLIKEAQDELLFIKTEADTLRKQERELWEKQRLAVYPESSAIMEQRMVLDKKIVELQNKILNQENIVFCLENGGMISSVTDKKGKEHTQIPDFRSVNTNQIYFDFETILIDKKPVYVPTIDEDNFRQRGYVFDAIRLDKDSYILAVKKHSEEEHTDYVLVTLDQLVLISDYYYTKQKAILLKEAQDKNKRSEEHWDKLPEEKRERFLNQKNLYHSLPVKVKKEITQENYEALDWKEKEKLYKFYKRYGSKKIVSKLGATQMWTSFHLMYERFIDPTAVPPKKGYGNAIVFDYWYAFSEMMKYKINDIEIQRDDLSEMRKIALETSYGESNTSDVLKQEFGILVKRQNGDKINPMEIDQIKNTFASVQNIFGNLKNIAAKQNIKISHTGVRYCFASKAIGMYVPKMGTIAVSDKHGDVQFKMTLAHETGHFIDNYIGELNKKSYASNNYESTAGQIAFVFRDNMNKPKSKHNNYVNSTQECFARAMEQYYGIEAFGEDAGIAFSYVPLDKPRPFFVADDFIGKDAYYNKLKPLIIQFFTENEDIFKYTVDVNETTEPVPIGTENENTKNITDAIEVLTVLMELSNETQKQELQTKIDDLKGVISSSSVFANGGQVDYSNIFEQGFGKIKVPYISSSGNIEYEYFKNPNYSRKQQNESPTYTIDFSDELRNESVIKKQEYEQKTAEYNLENPIISIDEVAKEVAKRINGKIYHKSSSRSRYIRIIDKNGGETTIRISDHFILERDVLNPKLRYDYEFVQSYFRKNDIIEIVNQIQNNHDIIFEQGGETKLLAPNGKPSNLTPDQYKLVRTPEFKLWFGDWEKLVLTKINDSGIDEISLKKLEDGVSKVVDENGEPLVVYHGSNRNFTVFDSKEIGSGSGNLGHYGFGFYFSEDIREAKGYGLNIFSCFIKINKPFLPTNKFIDLLKENNISGIDEKVAVNIDFDDLHAKIKPIDEEAYVFFQIAKENGLNNVWDVYLKTNNPNNSSIDLNDLYEILSNTNLFKHDNNEVPDYIISDINNMGIKPKINYDYEYEQSLHWITNLGENSKEVTDVIKKIGFDGVIAGSEYVLFESNQIKLADGTNTTFDNTNPDIRFDDGGEVKNETLKQVEDFKNLIEKELGIKVNTRTNPITSSMRGYVTFTPKKQNGEWVDFDYNKVKDFGKGKQGKEPTPNFFTKEKIDYYFGVGIYDKPTKPKQEADPINKLPNKIGDIYIPREKRNKNYFIGWTLDLGYKKDSNGKKLKGSGGWGYAPNTNPILIELTPENIKRYTLGAYSTDLITLGDGERVPLMQLNNILEKPILENGGEINTNEDLYQEWKELVNMSASELEKFKNTPEGKKAGLTKTKAKQLGISSGQESSEWILKMKNTDVKNWTPEMWKWAAKQVAFIKRMSGVKGDLFNEKNEKTPKHNALLIWGHNPVKTKKLKKGGETKKVHDYCCAMLYFNNPKLTDIHDKIIESDVYVDENDDSFGLENEPHTTLLDGLHKEVADNDVFNTIKKHNIPNQINLENVSLFENEKYDVLKFDVNEPVLHKINKDLAKYPHTNSYPDYHPHCTIAYLKKGKGKKYCNMFDDLKITVLPEKIVYSKTDGSKITKPL